MSSVGQINSGYNPGAFNGNQAVKEGQGFDDTLKNLISQVDGQLKESAQKTEDFATGRNQSLHEVMIASEKAGISLKFLIQIRNKLLEAYQEIMRMNF